MPDPAQTADEITVELVGVDTQPLPMVFDNEMLTDPWACAGADAGPPEDLG